MAALLERFYPDYRDENWHFRRLVAQHVSPGARVLEAGCGRDTDLSGYLREAGCRVVGIDLSPALSENSALHYPVRGDLEALPFANESVDLVTCRYVVEHLKDPVRAFGELARVLRRGGKVVLLTPNRWHYVTLIARLTPHAFHRWVNVHRGVPAEDVFPTRYQANSRRQLLHLAHRCGLRAVEIQLLELRPNYLLFSTPTLLLGVLYERLVNRISWLSPLRVNILAVLEKPSA
ncbi:MAG TPA: class I SAM-dependent methyltransferase [Candidatus Xenobia bacterium]|nr:class I SAM-dependent methyltransferase [Candidatus Xenobia bacterium]